MNSSIVLIYAAILGCFFFLPMVISLDIVDTVLTVSSPFSLADNEILTMSNSTLILDTTSISIGLNVQFQFSLDCGISSLQTLAILSPVSIQSYGSASLSTLTLSNTQLSFTTTSTFTDTLLVLDGTSSLVSVSTTGYFAYSTALSSPSTSLFTGGRIIVVPGATSSIAAGFQVSTSSSTTPTVNLGTSIIYNAKTFLSNVPLVVNGNNLKGGQWCNYQFQAPITASGSLNFTNCGLTMVAVNMNGGSVNLESSTWSLNNYIADVVSTTLNFNSLTTIALISPDVGSETFGSISLDSNSFINFNDPSTTKINVVTPMLKLFQGTLPHSSLLFTIASSAKGNINCNGSSFSRFRNPTLINPSTTLTTLLTQQKKIEAYSECTSVSLSLYTYHTDFNYENKTIWGSQCPDNTVRCWDDTSGICFSTLNFMSTSPCGPICSAAGAASGSTLHCWNGKCTAAYELCEPFPACPSNLPLRCSGVCKAANEVCDPCPTGTTECPLGCINSTQTCQPFNGCGVGQYQCPNSLACVSNLNQCTGYGSSKIPSSNRVLRTSTLVFDDTKSTAALWQRYFVPTTPFTITSKMFINFGSALPSNSYASEITPVPDSIASQVSGSLISSTFDYYSKLLTPPFKVEVRDISKNVLSITTTTSIYIVNDNLSLNLANACLAFINSANQWECSSLSLVSHSSNSIIEAKVNQLPASFALISTI